MLGAGGHAKSSLGSSSIPIYSNSFAHRETEVLQYLTTCLVLTFSRSWALPFVQAVAQPLASTILASGRSETATVATAIGRALASTAAVKAFNAALYRGLGSFDPGLPITFSFPLVVE
jgi:hypothetical protein